MTRKILLAVDGVDGETFGIFYKDKKLKHPSKFNVKFLESEQVGTPLGVRFSARSLYEKLGEKNLIDENIFDVQTPGYRFRFGGFFGYKFNRAIYEAVLEKTLGVKIAVRGAFNNVCFDTAIVEAFAEALRNRIDRARNDAEAWFYADLIDGQFIEYSDRSGVFRFYVEKTFRVDELRYKKTDAI